MKYSIKLILSVFILIFTSCSSQIVEKQYKKLENQVMDKLSDDKIAYQQFITLGKAVCYDKSLGNTSIFEEKYIDMFNYCTPLPDENSRYVQCTAFPRLLNENSDKLKQYIYEYINRNYKYSINLTTNNCDNLFLDSSLIKKTYKNFILNINDLNYENMSSEIDDYLKYGYILIMTE